MVVPRTCTVVGCCDHLPTRCCWHLRTAHHTALLRARDCCNALQHRAPACTQGETVVARRLPVAMCLLRTIVTCRALPTRLLPCTPRYTPHTGIHRCRAPAPPFLRLPHHLATRSRTYCYTTHSAVHCTAPDRLSATLPPLPPPAFRQPAGC